MQLWFPFALLIWGAPSWSQSLWHQIPQAEQRGVPDDGIVPTAVYELAYLKYIHRFGIDADEEYTAELPDPDGQLHSFRFRFRPVMDDPQQQIKYRTFTYVGYRIDRPTHRAQLSFGPWGLIVTVFTPEGIYAIEPTEAHDKTVYRLFTMEDVHVTPWLCGTTGQVSASSPPTVELREDVEDWPLLKYRIAISCTGEWGRNPNLGGGDSDKALSKIMSALHVINGIFEREHGITFTLVPNNKAVIFTNPSTDPFPAATTGSSLLASNTAVLNRRIGTKNYDIGHIFTIGCKDVGGIASLSSVCSDQGKGAGVTCWYTNSTNYVAIQISCHEIGHQFSATHTFNNCNGNEATGSAFEPGGGSTIMSYSGLCGPQSFVPRADPYFHNHSLKQIYRFARQGTGNSCAQSIDTGNTRPIATIPIEGGFTIPYKTPFELTGIGQDAEDTTLLYTWEQYTTGTIYPLGNPKKENGNVPLFRSRPPKENPTRVFPQLRLILFSNNNLPITDRTEILPPYSFDMKMAFTVRDYHPGAGATNWAYIEFKVTEKAGPFQVTSPNADTTWIAGTYQRVRWDVANTDRPPVNCQYVDIYFFDRSHYDRPILLAEKVRNDGEAFVQVPDMPTRRGRIKVKAHNSIFFDVSNEDITVVRDSILPFSYAVLPDNIFACLPTTEQIQVRTTGSPDDTLQFVAITGLPQGVEYEIVQDKIAAGDTFYIELDFQRIAASLDTQMFITLQRQDTLLTLGPIAVHAVRNYYDSLRPLSPVSVRDHSTGPLFQWKADRDADSYEFQLATSPSFDAASIVYSVDNLDDTTVRAPTLLDENSLYFWRVRGINQCGKGPWTPTAIFSTRALDCRQYQNNQSVSVTRGQSKSSPIDVPDQILISDVNLPLIHLQSGTSLKDVQISLIGPEDTMLLWNRRCITSTTIKAGFDDDAPELASCFNLDRSKLLRPMQDSLAIFNGQKGQGNWQLQVSLSRNANRTTRLFKWQLELCGAVALQSPTLLTNDTILVGSYATAPLQIDAQAPDQASTLYVLLLDTPSNGTVERNNTPLTIGSAIPLSDIHNGSAYYRSSQSEGVDSFHFLLWNGKGSWIGPFTKAIVIDPTIDTRDVSHNDKTFRLNPNPAHQQLHIDCIAPCSERIDRLDIFTLQGQRYKSLHHIRLPYLLRVDDIPPGIYWFVLRTANHSERHKIAIQHAP